MSDAFQPRLCECGCGEQTNRVAKGGDGYQRGEYRRFRYNHWSRVQPTGVENHKWVRGTVRVGGYVGVQCPGHLRVNDRGYVLVHLLVAERALGRPIMPPAEVHHIDEDKTNNVPSNLVICQDSNYHRLLHRRARAYAATGNPNAIRCTHCKQYGTPENPVRVQKAYNFHRICRRDYYRQWKLSHAD